MTLPVIPCLKCGVANDAQADTEGTDATPEPDDLSICAYCGHLAVFTTGDDGQLAIRELTEEEQEYAANDEHIQELLAYRARVMGP